MAPPGRRFESVENGYNEVGARSGGSRRESAGGKPMSWEASRDEIDLTESSDVVSAMSAAVGRLRQLAAAAFNADPGKHETRRHRTDVGSGSGGSPSGARRGGRYPLAMEDSPEIYENMGKALAILTAWNESGDGDLTLVEQTTNGYLQGHPDAEARLDEAIRLISGLVSLGGRMLLQLSQSLGMSEDELLRIMGQRIAYRT
jgi:hypothetical protein